MQQPQRCIGSLSQPLLSMLQIKQMQKIYCWKLFSVLVVFKVSINRDNQARSVKQLARASSFKMRLFPFPLVPWPGHPWCATHGDRLYKSISESQEKLTPRWKPWAQPHKLHLLPKFRCPSSTTTQCCLGGGRQSGVGESTPPAPCYGHRLKVKAVTKQGEDREIQPVSLQYQCRSVHQCPQRTWNILTLCIQCLTHCWEQ